MMHRRLHKKKGHLVIPNCQTRLFLSDAASRLEDSNSLILTETTSDSIGYVAGYVTPCARTKASGPNQARTQGNLT